MLINISIKELHLAAYIKSMGGRLVHFENDHYVFESDKSESDWRIRHSNSESLLVDRELLTLKNFIRKR